MKRSIFLGIATALTLIVFLAGFAYAATGWDSHPWSRTRTDLAGRQRLGAADPVRHGQGRLRPLHGAPAHHHAG
jgi:hypothetical protein